jgi:hypothetical protein
LPSERSERSEREQMAPPMSFKQFVSSSKRSTKARSGSAKEPTSVPRKHECAGEQHVIERRAEPQSLV